VTPEAEVPTPAKETKTATRASSKKPKTEVKKDLTSSFEKITVEPKKTSKKGSNLANFGFIIAFVVAIIAALLYAANKYKLIKFK